MSLGLVLERQQSFLFQIIIIFIFRNRVMWLIGNREIILESSVKCDASVGCGHWVFFSIVDMEFFLLLLFKQSSDLWKWHIYAFVILHVHLRISRASSSRITESSHSSLLVVTLRCSWVMGSYEVGNDLNQYSSRQVRIVAFTVFLVCDWILCWPPHPPLSLSLSLSLSLVTEVREV